MRVRRMRIINTHPWQSRIEIYLHMVNSNLFWIPAQQMELFSFVIGMADVIYYKMHFLDVRERDMVCCELTFIVAGLILRYSRSEKVRKIECVHSLHKQLLGGNLWKLHVDIHIYQQDKIEFKASVDFEYKSYTMVAFFMVSDSATGWDSPRPFRSKIIQWKSDTRW